MKKRVVIVGAGPAGLIAAEVLAKAGVAVEIYDRMAAPGRKFLMAGRGGLNLTHSEDFAGFLARYGDAAGWLKPYLESFPPQAVRDWAAGLGVETFVGTSGRVFPQDMKATPLLRAQVKRLAELGVQIHLGETWLGFSAEGALRFDKAGTVSADAVLLALGGASWPRLGSNGAWVPLLAGKGVAISPFRPANCGFTADWSAPMAAFAGTPLKGIALKAAEHTSRGEAVITKTGIEGGGIYALSRFLRDAIDTAGSAMLVIDLRPDRTAEQVAEKLSGGRRGASLTNRLRRLHLSPAAVCLMREGHGVQLPSDPAALAGCVKSVPLRLTGTAGLDRAISSAGGLCLDETGPDLQLKKIPGVFVAGEMLNWEAPTGGYLLTACYALGRAAADGILQKLDMRP